MAVPPEHLDAIAATIADLYRDVESALVQIVTRELRRDLDEDDRPSYAQTNVRLRRSAEAVYLRLQRTKAAAIRAAIQQAYRDGAASALTGLPVSRQVRDDARRALADVPNAALVENIAAAVHADLGRVEGNILRAPLDAYRAVQASAAARIATGVLTRRQASQAAWQRLVDQGIGSFTDRAGRRWKLSSYAEMIGRTNIQRAAVQGQMDRLASAGIDLVYISDTVQECKVCRPFEGKVLRRDSGPTGKIQVQHATRDGEQVTVDVLMTLDQARAKGLFHPNCRHSASAYLPGVTKLRKGTADPEGDKARQRQRALERKIRAAKERELAAFDEASRREARQQVRAAQAALRDHLKAHPYLKRLPYREQIGAGNIPPMGGPLGGPAADFRPPTGGPATGPRPAADRLRADEAAERAEREAREAAERARRQVPAHARPYHRNLDGIEDLVQKVEIQDERDTRRLGGLSAQTELVTLADGTKVIRKSARAGLDEMQDAAAEHATSLIARKLGLRAPGVYRRDERSIYMEYMGGVTPDEAGAWGDLPERFAKAVASDEGKRLGLLDLLVMNIDRNQGNWLLDGRDRLIPIDHGASFVNSLGDPAADLEYVNNPFVDHYKAGYDQLKDNPLTKADVEEVRRRLEELREDFDHMGKGEWLDYSLRVLDRLAEHAKGTRDLIAGVR